MPVHLWALSRIREQERGTALVGVRGELVEGGNLVPGLDVAHVCGIYTFSVGTSGTRTSPTADPTSTVVLSSWQQASSSWASRKGTEAIS